LEKNVVEIDFVARLPQDYVPRMKKLAAYTQSPTQSHECCVGVLGHLARWIAPVCFAVGAISASAMTLFECVVDSKAPTFQVWMLHALFGFVSATVATMYGHAVNRKRQTHPAAEKAGQHAK
jgi:hypothetical protein